MAVLARTKRIIGLATTRIVLSVCFLLCVSEYTLAQCNAPHYRTGIVWKDSKSSVEMQISIRLSDFDPSKLVCLAKSLRERYRDRKKITFYIFSSQDAAKHWFPQQERTRESTEIEAAMRGAYFYDVDMHEEYLVMMPGPRKSYGGGPFDTRIDLPVSGTPQCRLQVNGRCLLVLQDPNYPSAALTAKVSGTVTLTGRIARNGVITDTHATETNVIPGVSKDLLVNGALENLGTWRLEPAPREDAIQITYSYRIDTSLGYKGQMDVEFAPPSHIVIRGNPPAN